MIKLNGTEIRPTIFPDKTSQVWKLPEMCFEGKIYTIEWEFENEAELFHLCQLVDLIRFGHIPKELTLHLPYLPYGRQDKDISNSNTFALITFGRIINTLKFDKVTTLDAHSIIGFQNIERFDSLYPLEEIEFAHNEVNADCEAFPDKGASDRYLCNHEDIIGHKVRDQLTGYITEYNIEGNPEGKDILIVDDICDGGMTFKLMAKELYNQGANSVHLYVTHGIFSKGVETLRADGIQRIFTKDGEYDGHPNNIDIALLQRTELSNL